MRNPPSVLMNTSYVTGHVHVLKRIALEGEHLVIRVDVVQYVLEKPENIAQHQNSHVMQSLDWCVTMEDVEVRWFYHIPPWFYSVNVTRGV